MLRCIGWSQKVWSCVTISQYYLMSFRIQRHVKIPPDLGSLSDWKLEMALKMSWNVICQADETRDKANELAQVTPCYSLLFEQLIMNSTKLVIPLHSLYWSIHTKDESKRGTAFAFIFGVNWLWRGDVTASFFMK